MVQPIMAMLIGPTGCGKSTYRAQNFTGKVPIISPDDAVAGKWTPDKASVAWGWARRMAACLIKDGDNFAVDAQFIDSGVRKDWLMLGKENGYYVEAICFATPWTQILKNHKKRGDRGGYGCIPPNVIMESFKTFERQIKQPRISFAGFDRVHIVRWGKVETGWVKR